ncbi:Transcriptional regulatory protein LEU3 [Penicillium lagena]|uniref:Transcriptional regulatory protein LEU3 n=1 Tax=Penicillium lagena TaxID=94218 RepID=UPI00254024FD|nr:Transcriptional regulatory protein LEU3 [Penicillium lagena]KAJ5602119.1 Transcriptional regulatory protein LEU3 [Penicillium lagena]
MKLGCNAAQSFPAPCSRCVRKNLTCSVDPSYKRVPKRGRLEAVEKELKDIKRRFLSQQQTTSTSTNESPSHAESNDPVPSRSPSPIEDIPAPLLTDKVLGEIILNPESISSILECYYQIYHPYFPIIPKQEKLLKSYEQDPILFWVVISIGSRNTSQYEYMQDALQGEIKSLVSNAHTPAKQSLQLIQALLLLCYWPFPFGATANDPSWSYSALSISCAYTKGVHRAEHLSDFEYDATPTSEMIVERKRTWIACFIVNQRLSSLNGFPPLVTPDHTIQSAVSLQPTWLPTPLVQQLYISYQSYKITSALGNSETQSSGLLPHPANLIRLFDSELRSTQPPSTASIDTDTSAWQESETIYLLATKLQLYSFALNLTSPASASTPENETLARSYTAAISLLQHALKVSPQIKYCPFHTIRYITYAIFVLFKLMACTTPEEFTDETTSRNLIARTWELFRQASHDTTDHVSRMCDIIQYLSTTRWYDEESPEVRVLSRGAANLVVEMIWRARRRFSFSVRQQKPKDYTLTAAEEKTWADMQSLFLSFVDEGWG